MWKERQDREMTRNHKYTRQLMKEQAQIKYIQHQSKWCEKTIL